MAKNKKDNGDQPESNSGNADDSADNFGLPDIDYKPLDREQETPRETVVETEKSSYSETTRTDSTVENTDYDDEPSSKAPLFIGLIIGVVILAAGFLIYKYWYVPKAAKEKAEIARLADEKKLADEKARIARANQEAEQRRADSLALANAKPKEGTMETLTERTRRFYVVVTSDIDDDLVMDYAKKLSVKGISTKMIPATGANKYFRLAIADFDTYDAAQSSADASKGEYGAGVWVIRY